MKKYKEETEKSLANLEICDIFPKYFIENQAKYEEFICKYNIVSKFKAVKLFYLAKLKKVFNKVFYPERR